VLCPMQDAPTDPKPGVEAFPLNTTAGTVGGEIERVCSDNELVIATWSPIHLRTKLKELYWKGDRTTANAAGFFEDTLRYLYLARLRSREVLTQTIRAGAASKDFFGVAYGEASGKLEGFSLGEGDVVFDDTLLLIEPGAATAYEAAQASVQRPSEPVRGFAEAAGTASATSQEAVTTATSSAVSPTSAALPKPKSFHATAEVPVATAKMRLVQLADEILSVLSSDPNASVRLVVEISAEFPGGVSDNVRRAVSENARSLNLKMADWE
jgi:uncharacterized protein